MQITTTLVISLIGGTAAASGLVWLQHHRARYAPATLIVAVLALAGAYAGWAWAEGLLLSGRASGLDLMIVRALVSKKIVVQDLDLLAVAWAAGAVLGAAAGKIALLLVPPPKKKTERGAVLADGGTAGEGDGVTIAGVRIPASVEARGIQMCGAPGTGKTQAILALLIQARRRGDRVIIADPAGDIMSRLYKEGDVILAPGDQRSESWSPFADLRDLSECDTLAASLVPPGHGSGEEWSSYARTLVSALLSSLMRRGEMTTGALTHAAVVADVETLRSLFAGTPAAPLVAEGNEKMLGSVRGVVGSALAALMSLDPRAGADAWSIRDWLESESSGWLWLPYRDSAAESTRPLRRAWLDIVVRGILDSTPGQGLATWIVLDELPAHGQLTALPGAVARGRKYNLRVVLGYQSASQIREIYGKDGAESVLGCTGNTLILRTPDPETADRLSRQIGDVERERQQQSVSKSSTRGHGRSSNVSVTTVTETRRAVLPAEIQELPDLCGYLQIAGDSVAARRVTVPIVRGLDVRVPAHVAAAASITAPPPAAPVSDLPAAAPASGLVTDPVPAAADPLPPAASPPPAVGAPDLADIDIDDIDIGEAFDVPDDFDPDA